MSRQNTPFPAGFFARQDESDDAGFYSFDRLVTHIDAGAIAAVGELYDELELTSAEVEILDICSSWISHFPTKPGRLVVTGMNSAEQSRSQANPSSVGLE